MVLRVISAAFSAILNRKVTVSSKPRTRMALAKSRRGKDDERTTPTTIPTACDGEPRVQAEPRAGGLGGPGAYRVGKGKEGVAPGP